jgi:F420-dependent oxidoreductase-like protein
MSDKTIGIAVSAPDPARALANILKAEDIGIKAAWMTSGGGGGDALTLFAAAAARTERILLGTSIVQTWSRHPITVAQQVRVIAGLAPGRFRLGVGPSHRQNMERTFGADFRAPLGHLREYITILKGLIQKGAIEFDGEYYTAHASLPGPINVPVMASALRSGAFALCGAEADGAITWVCPHSYVRDTALPALKASARQAGRAAPPVIVHAPVCVDEDVEAARNAVRKQLGYFPSSPFYARMFADAGFPNSPETGWTDEMLDSVLLAGDEATVAEKLAEVFSWGAAEVLATVIPVGDAPEKSAERTMQLLAEASAS